MVHGWDTSRGTYRLFLFLSPEILKGSSTPPSFLSVNVESILTTPPLWISSVDYVQRQGPSLQIRLSILLSHIVWSFSDLRPSSPEIRTCSRVKFSFVPWRLSGPDDVCQYTQRRTWSRDPVTCSQISEGPRTWKESVSLRGYNSPYHTDKEGDNEKKDLWPFSDPVPVIMSLNSPS